MVAQPDIHRRAPLLRVTAGLLPAVAFLAIGLLLPGGIPRDSAFLALVISAGGFAVYVVHIVGATRPSRAAIYSAVVVLVCAEILDLTENFEALADIPVLGNNSPWNRQSSVMFIVGMLLLLGGFIYTSVESGLGRKANERYQLLAENMSDVLWTANIDLRATYVSPSVEALTGYKPRFFLGKSLREILTATSAGHAMNSALRVLDRATQGAVQPDDSFVLESEARKKDGSTVWVETRARFLFDDQGRPASILGVSRDITERMRMLEENQQLSIAVQNAMAGVSKLDREGRFVYAREDYASLLGYTPEELVGQSWQVTVHPEDLELCTQTYRQMLAEGRAEARIRARRKDGSEFIKHLLLIRLDDVAGHHDGHYCFMRDVTEEARAEMALRESQQRLLEAQRVARIGSFEIFVDRQPLAWSDQMFALFGLDGQATQPTLEFFFRLIHPDDVPLYRLEVERTLETGRGYRIEFRGRHADGHWRHFETIATATRDSDGAIAGLRGTVQDISDRVAAREQLRQLADRLELAHRASKSGVWDWDVSADKLDWDDWTLAIYGLSREDFAGSFDAWRKCVHPEDVAATEQRVRRAMRDSSDFETRFRVIHPNGRVRHVRAVGYIVRDSQGSPVRMIGTDTDITEQVEAEQERERLQNELLRAQRLDSIGRLAGGIAHDFNNMLAVIIGNTECAKQASDLSEETRRELELVLDAAERATEMTSQLLSFARQKPAEPVSLDVGHSLEKMVHMVRRLIPENVDLAFEPEPDVWRVQIDPSHLDQIVANLCLNARDAIEEYGAIHVSVSNQPLEHPDSAALAELEPGDYVRLSVRDTGCGMDEETLGQVFDPFFTTKGAAKGTGLGLSTVYGIVNQNGGCIRVSSKPGSGTTFDVYLPRHRAEQPGERESDDGGPAPPPHGTETVLVVEDEPSILALTKMMLERLGYRALTSASSSEALTIARQRGTELDLLLSDIVMPEMNGFELAERMTDIVPGLQCLFMSGYAPESLDKYPNGPSHRILRKPFRLHDFAVAVRETLDNPSSEKLTRPV